jgi:hypothetical protein
VDELEEGLRRRDKRFLVRVVLLVGIATLGGAWLMNRMASTDVGGCFARGFSTITETPATP